MLKTYIKDSSPSPDACVIWLHGLGADAANMMAVAAALPDSSLPIRHVFVDAPVRSVTLNNHQPMRAWYDITGLTIQDREDSHGILDSEQKILDIIAHQISQGMDPRRIYVAGFSQGGAMALFIAMRTQQSLGGVIALSAYLPLQTDCWSGNQLSLPLFMAVGSLDQVVLPSWTQQAHAFIVARGFSQLCWKEYRMEHQICQNEITDIATWLTLHLSLLPGESA